MPRSSQRKIFGDGRAERDPLLYDCRVTETSVPEGKSILVGRWGMGKTALLLLKNETLSKVLAADGPDKERLWLISEKGMDAKTLKDLSSAEPDRGIFLRALEELWRAEIVRVYCVLLTQLRRHYAASSRPHWQFIKTIAGSEPALSTVWHLAKVALSIAGGNKSNQLEELREAGARFFGKKTLDNLKRCLRDIADDEPRASLAIEPIETPTSPIEQASGVAQPSVTALLNVFRTYFGPGTEFDVLISIPWHRYQPELLDSPQHLREDIGVVRWSKPNLRTFINKRIDSEFALVRRRKKGAVDAWQALFEDRIADPYCKNRVYEDTFDYCLRHTHHRPRDILRLARRCVETQAELWDTSTDTVLKATHGTRITARAIGEAVRRECFDSAKELIIEASRRLADLEPLTAQLHGLSMPFTRDQLEKRLRDPHAPDTASSDRAINTLWDAGVLGLVASTDGEDAAHYLQAAFGTEARRRYTDGDNRKYTRWFWFEYNYDGSGQQLASRLAALADLQSQFVIHPRLWQTIPPGPVNSPTPIGV